MWRAFIKLQHSNSHSALFLLFCLYRSAPLSLSRCFSRSSFVCFLLSLCVCVCDQSLLDISSSLILVLPSSSSCRAVETQSVPAGLTAPADPTASKCVNSTDFVDIFPPPLRPFLSFATDSVTYFLVSCFLMFFQVEVVLYTLLLLKVSSSLPTDRFA